MESAKLTILGASPAWTNPGGAGSGYLLRSGVTAVQIEAGSGTFGRLRKIMSVEQLSGVIISHVHADHFLDLVPLCYGLIYGKIRSGAPLPVYVPPGGTEFLRSFTTVLNGDAEFFTKTFDIREYAEGTPFTIGELTFNANWVQHFVPSYSIRCEVGRGFVFSADSGPCDELVQAAKDVGTLLCEAAITKTSEDAPDPKHRGHLTAAEAANLAQQAGVKHLILTHFRTDIQTHASVRAQAKLHFSGRLTLARELRSYSL